MLTKFGVVVLWNMGEGSWKLALKELVPFVKSRQDMYPYGEKLEVAVTGRGHDRAEEDYVELADASLGRVKLISFAIAQSVALERYEDEIEKALGDAEKNIEGLKTMGRIVVSSQKLLRQIGAAMSVKQVAVAHLSLFDKPEEAWESPELEKLYLALRGDFELVDRFDVLNEKINFLSENARMLAELVGERRMLLLELVIVVFFAIDIILLLWETFT